MLKLSVFHCHFSNSCLPHPVFLHIYSLLSSLDLITVSPSAFSILLSAVCCFQRREVHSNQPFSCIRPACRELPCQTSLLTEEPVPAAHVTWSPAATDWHTVRAWDNDRNVWGCSQSCRGYNVFAFIPFRSDKLRWISALSRPHSEIDFSAAQGKDLAKKNPCLVHSVPT